jgi:hypothetical protein
MDNDRVIRRYRKKGEVFAVRFLYIDNIDGKETIKFAKSIGLSRNGDGGISLLWEIQTQTGWKIVNHGDYVVDNNGVISVMNERDFEATYEAV